MRAGDACFTITYNRDNDGNVTAVNDSSIVAGTYLTTYDALNRRFDETVAYLPGGNRVLSHRYDRYGNRKQLTVTDGAAIVHNYTYDKLNRLASASLAGATVTASYFANDDLQTLTLPNGVSRSYTWQANGPVNTVTVNGPAIQLAQFAYTYDNVLNVDTLTTADGVHDYHYDGLNRLTQAFHPAPSGLPTPENYLYTAAGDRQSASNPSAWTYDNNHRITASTGLTYTHDAAGNLATRSDAFSLTHDARQRLTQVVKSGVTSSYLQDPYGRRIRKSVGGVVTWFLWDGTQLLSEYNGSGSRTKRYAYLGEDFAPTQVADPAGVYYLHADQLQTPRLLTNSTAQIVWRARYQAYGSAVVQEDPDANGTAITLNLRFPGQYWDAETGLHQNYYRDYEPGLGRYVQADPIGLEGGINTYAYVNGNPVSKTDPTGLDPGMGGGTDSCAHYAKRCAQSGGTSAYYCRIAPLACNYTPPSEWTRCVRQCLQDFDKACGRCSDGSPDVQCTAEAHAHCWIQCVGK